MKNNPIYPLYRHISNRVPAPCRIGIFPVGLKKYWSQFPGLLDDLNRRVGIFVKRLGNDPDVQWVCAPMTDSAEAAFRTAEQLRAADCDLIFCYLATYAPAATVVPVVQSVNRPVFLVSLQPDARMEYDRATQYRQLLNDNCTSLPEIANGMIRVNHPPAGIVVGRLEDDLRAEVRIQTWVRLGKVLHALRGAVIGQMGHTYEGMLDMHTDPTLATRAFQCHVQMIEPEELLAEVKAVQSDAMRDKIHEVEGFFDFPGAGTDPHAGPVTREQLEYSSRVAVGLDRLVEKNHLRGLCYYYIGEPGGEIHRLIPGMIVGNSLLTARGIPVAGECDLKTCLAMLMMDRLGAGGSFSELHPLDFVDDFVLVGHDGPAHAAIADRKPVLRGLSLLHGKEGQGASVEFSLKAGPITIAGLTIDSDNRFKLALAEGESLKGATPATGNTNTRAKFRPDTATFIERWSMEGLTHHFATGIGHFAGELAQLAAILNIPSVNVTACLSN
ncbi:MAG: L-fucose/L-arabinose isomerase family protein [Verrucomicrobiae bacterium]|nr:L-fucose/L-arabinose isomerase family protein [Verrucomicrobiae bacterium]